MSPTEWSTATAQQLLARYGVVTRDVAAAEGITGGFSAVYDVLKALEDAGRIRRGYFVAGVGATQFALPAALDLLRSLRELPEEAEVVALAATDPANPYGTTLPWPGAAAENDGARRTTRSVGSLVILVNGALGAYISRGARQLQVFLPEDEPARSTVGRGGCRAAGCAGERRRHAHRRSQRGSDRRTSHRAVPGRRRLRALRDGLHDEARACARCLNFQLQLPTKKTGRPIGMRGRMPCELA